MKKGNKQHFAGSVLMFVGAIIVVAGTVYALRGDLVPTHNGNLTRAITIGVVGLFCIVAGAKMTVESDK